MLDTHTATRVCGYIYTDIYERDYYRHRFTYIINTRNHCRIFKTAESAPDIRERLSLSLPSRLVPLVRLANATCQSSSWGGCSGVLGGCGGGRVGAGEPGLPTSHTCALHSARGRRVLCSPSLSTLA